MLWNRQEVIGKYLHDEGLNTNADIFLEHCYKISTSQDYDYCQNMHVLMNINTKCI